MTTFSNILNSSPLILVAVSRFPPESVNAPSLLGGVLGGVTAVVMGGFLVIAVFICYKVSAGP